MFGTYGGELAKLRAESLRGDGGSRSAKSPGRLRKALGHRLVEAGKRLLGRCPDGGTHAVGIGGGG